MTASEDEKLVALAKHARSRVDAVQGAAVRDETGRSYTGATVQLPPLAISALDLAVANAVAAGAHGLEAAAVVGPGEVNVDAALFVGGPDLPIHYG